MNKLTDLQRDNLRVLARPLPTSAQIRALFRRVNAERARRAAKGTP